MNFTSNKINPAVWGTCIVLLMLPELLMLDTKTWWDAPVVIVFNILFYGFFAWLFCGLASLTGRRTELALQVVLQAVMAAYSVSNVFMLIMFNRHWDAYSWQFLCETNERESSEFFSSYVLSLPTLVILAGYVALFVAEVRVGRRVKRCRLFPRRRLWAVAASIIGMVMVGQTIFFGPDVQFNYERVAKYHSPIKRNAMWNIWQSALIYDSFRDEFARCA